MLTKDFVILGSYSLYIPCSIIIFFIFYMSTIKTMMDNDMENTDVRDLATDFMMYKVGKWFL